MLFWVGIGLLQAVALPGHLLCRALRLDEDSRIQTAVLAFGFSLLLNHFLVIGLVLAGAFHRPALVAVIASELVAEAWLLTRRRPRPPALGEQILAALRSGGAAQLWAAVAALGVFVWLLLRLPSGFGQGFELWDTVQLWNRWALDWDAGQLPVFTHHYPQVVPSVWALLYILQGNTLPFAAHGMMGLFPLATAALLIDLGIRRRDPVWHGAAALMGLLWATLMACSMASGHVDVPVGFLSLLAFYPLLAAPPGEPLRGEGRRLVACTLAAACAVLTKQTALFVVAVLPALVWLRLSHRPARSRILAAAGVGAGAVLVAAPWFAWIQLRIFHGLDVAFSARAVRVAQDFGGWAGALDRLQHSLTAPGLALLVAGLLLSLRHREIRWITVLVTLPFSALWLTLAGYDTRNLALVVPCIGISGAAGVAVLCGDLHRLSRPVRGAAIAALAAFCGLALLQSAQHVDTAHLAARNEAQWIELGDSSFNRKLLAYVRSHELDGKILTDNRSLLMHPELRDSVFVDREARGLSSDPFLLNSPRFGEIVEDQKNGIRYLVVSRHHLPAPTRWVRQALRSHRIELLFRGKRARFFRVHPPED